MTHTHCAQWPVPIYFIIQAIGKLLSESPGRIHGLCYEAVLISSLLYDFLGGLAGTVARAGLYAADQRVPLGAVWPASKIVLQRGYEFVAVKGNDPVVVVSCNGTMPQCRAFTQVDEAHEL